jgi:hypothetical protein
VLKHRCGPVRTPRPGAPVTNLWQRAVCAHATPESRANRIWRVFAGVERVGPTPSKHLNKQFLHLRSLLLKCCKKSMLVPVFVLECGVFGCMRPVSSGQAERVADVVWFSPPY